MTQLTRTQRLLLALPIPGALIFGLGPLVIPVLIARWLGYTGDEPYLVRLAGAATVGYAVALAIASTAAIGSRRGSSWSHC
jgi:hypothetical protein